MELCNVENQSKHWLSSRYSSKKSISYAVDAFLRSSADLTTFDLIFGDRSNLWLDKMNRKLFGRPTAWKRRYLLPSVPSLPLLSLQLGYLEIAEKPNFAKTSSKKRYSI